MGERQAVRKGYAVIVMFTIALYTGWRSNCFKTGTWLSPVNRFDKVLERTRFFGVRVINTPETRKKRKFASKYFTDSGNVMDPFFKKLYMLENKKYDKNVKIMFLGTSSIGFDRVTSRMREVLQPVFGDGGKGFVTATKGWLYHRHQDINWNFSDSWEYQSVTNHKRDRHNHGNYGLGGVVSFNKGASWIDYRTVKDGKKGYAPGTKFSKFSLFYNKYNNGGLVTVNIDGRDYSINTRSAKPADDVFEADVSDGPHHVRITTDSNPSGIYGAAFDRKKGLIIDALMYVGVYIHQLLYFDRDHISSMIASRNPDLLIFNMGAKDAYYNPDNVRIEKISNLYANAIRNFMSKVKGTPCLVISIKDLGEKVMGKVATKPGIEKMVEQSRMVAEKTGCAFFNMFEAMGGKGSMERWRIAKTKLVSDDLGHLLNPGAVKIGNIISNMLLEEYAGYKKTLSD
ncbi:MAG: hypothetical protein JXA66_02015 [Oligoflexia bacterium]|nr:hypothetical protein [Oligoflexia bacterium]